MPYDDFPLAEPIAGMCEFAFHPSTNSPNFEASWRVLWTDMLLTWPEQPQHRLLPTSEYPLSQRNAIRNPIPPLYRSTPGESTETEDEDTDEEDYPEPFHREAVSPGINPLLVPDPPSPAEPEHPPVDPNVWDIFRPRTPSPKPAQGNQETPSSTSTRPIKQGRDARFNIDFAVVHIARSPSATSPGARQLNIFGRLVCFPTVTMPIALELKRSVSRRTAEDFFEIDLATRIALAYDELQKKMAVAFVCHKTQESIVGIAASAIWWSFTVARRGRRRVTWSKAFVCGYPPHDDIFQAILLAAAIRPSDPANAVGQEDTPSIENLLEMNVRANYEEADVLADL